MNALTKPRLTAAQRKAAAGLEAARRAAEAATSGEVEAIARRIGLRPNGKHVAKYVKLRTDAARADIGRFVVAMSENGHHDPAYVFEGCEGTMRAAARLSAWGRVLYEIEHAGDDCPVNGPELLADADQRASARHRSLLNSTSQTHNLMGIKALQAAAEVADELRTILELAAYAQARIEHEAGARA